MRFIFFLLLCSLPVTAQTKHVAFFNDVDNCNVVGMWLQTTNDATVRQYVKAKIAGIQCVDLEGRAETYRVGLGEPATVSILGSHNGQWFVTARLLKTYFAVDHVSDRTGEGEDLAEHLISRGLAFALPLSIAQAELLDVATVARYHAAQKEARKAKKGIWHYGDDVDPFPFSGIQPPLRPNSPTQPNLPTRGKKANTGQFKSKKNP